MPKPVAEYTYTDQEILDAARQALVDIALDGQQRRTVAGREFTGASIEQLRRLANEFEARVRQSSGTSPLARNRIAFSRR